MEQYTVKDLLAALREGSMDISGTKAVLQQRLRQALFEMTKQNAAEDEAGSSTARATESTLRRAGLNAEEVMELAQLPLFSQGAC